MYFGRYYNPDSWMQVCNSYPYIYGPHSDNIGGYLTITNTLSDGRYSTVKVWVGNENYKEMYEKAVEGNTIDYSNLKEQ